MISDDSKGEPSMGSREPVPLSGRNFVLRPIVPDDYPALYHWASAPPTSQTWRLRGTSVSPEQFTGVPWSEVLAQFVIAPVADARPAAGLVQAFNHDAANRVAYLSVIVAPEHQRRSSAMGEAVALFVSYLFDTFDLRK
jgi:RimJ/RimL family protein N-acetyltransferase